MRWILWVHTPAEKHWKPLSGKCKQKYALISNGAANEMYEHTKNVNTYYFAEIAVDADHDGNIYECRKRGFESLESNPDFLQNTVRKGNYGEDWSLRKVLRRFIWHDRIHARAMYRMAIKVFGAESIVNPFYFFDEGVLT